VAEVPVDVRILSASHKDLAQEVSTGRFRQDLYYRLNVILITLPALRDRLEDLPRICEQVLRRIALESGLDRSPVLHPSAHWALQHYPFPGNVRELENILHRAVALSGNDGIDEQDLGLPVSPPQAPPAASAPRPAITPSAATPPTAPSHMRSQEPGQQPLPSDLALHLDHIERDILVQALEKHRLNRTAAGASLGLSLRQMRYRMARLGVQVSSQGVEIGERFDPDQPDPDTAS
jgi:two-component system response regulator PilR (NtrC family)